MAARDDGEVASRLAEKVARLRVFENEEGRFDPEPPRRGWRGARRQRELGVEVATGVFSARMEVALVNDGPVTIVLDA